MTLTVTFKLGTDVDKAQVQVQNRVAQALPKLPRGRAAHRRHDREVDARHHDGRAPHLAGRPLRPALPRELRDAARARTSSRASTASATCSVFGAGDYSMRVWLDPDKVAAREPHARATSCARSASRTCRSPPGQLGAPPAPNARRLPAAINTKGRLVDEDEFGNIIVKTGERRPDHAPARRRARRARRRATTRCARCSTTSRRSRFGIFQRARQQRDRRSRRRCARRWRELKKRFPEGVDYDIVYDPTVFVRESIDAVVHTLFEAILLVVHRRDRVPADLARVDHSAARRAGVADRHVRGDASVRLLAQHAVAVRPRARDRHRRRRRDRRRRERRAQHRARD